MNIATSGDSPGATKAEETAEVITPVKSAGVLDTILDTPGLSSTFLLAKDRTAGRSDLKTAKARAPTPGALDSLLDTTGLPDTFLGSRTPNRPPLGLMNTFSHQVGTERSVSSENFSPLICSESEAIEVSSQEFLEGLAKSKGRKTSSKHCLLVSDDGMHQDKPQNCPRYSFAGLSSSNLSEVSIVFSNPRNPSHKPLSSREGACNSCLPQDRPKRKPGQESSQENTAQRDGAPDKHRHKYSHEEDSHLVNFFLTEGCYGERKGVAVWKRVVAEEICPGRTWQSLKEHFLKKILLGTSLKKLKVTENALLQASDRSKKPSSSNRYTREEDREIVKFIRTRIRINKANGNMVWKVLSAQDRDKKRSWQSLRGRFLKVMMKRKEEFGL